MKIIKHQAIGYCMQEYFAIYPVVTLCVEEYELPSFGRKEGQWLGNMIEWVQS